MKNNKKTIDITLSISSERLVMKKVIATKILSLNTTYKMFEKNPSINDFFDYLLNGDYFNQMQSALFLPLQIYEIFIRSGKKTAIIGLVPIKDFLTKYPELKQFEHLLSEKNKDTITKIKSLTDEYNLLLKSGYINSLSTKDLYIKILQTQINIYKEIGTKKYMDLIPEIENRLTKAYTNK